MGRRLIVVAREEADLYDFIRRDQFGDDNVVVIADRRAGGDRRRRDHGVTPDRRRDDRRQLDIDTLLRTQGWGEVPLAGG
jgi:hypothetical protein